MYGKIIRMYGKIIPYVRKNNPYVRKNNPYVRKNNPYVRKIFPYVRLLWKIMLLIMHETAASQDQPGRHPGPPPRVGTSIGTCLSPNRQGTPGSPACARYGKETPVMERKRRLWKISDLYGKKATFMENKRPLWKESVVLWKIKFTYGKKVLVWPLYG